MLVTERGQVNFLPSFLPEITVDSDLEDISKEIC